MPGAGAASRLLRHAEPGPFTCIAAAAASRHGLITTSELRGCGLSSSAISRWTKLGRLERLAPSVYRLASAPDTWHQRAAAAVLGGPETTVLSHRAAAALHGMRGFRRALVEITSTRWSRARLRGVRIHESLELPATDLTVVDGIPVTNLVRTTIDLGAVAHPYKIGAALDEERRRQRLDLRQVRARLDELAVQGRNGICVVRELLDLRQGKALASTGLEQLFLGVVHTYDLPVPRMQWRVVDGDFVAYLDYAYPDEMVVIEMDSEEFHLDLAQFQHDRARQNRLVLLGWRFLRFTSAQIRTRPLLVARQVADALGIEFSPRSVPLSGTP